MASSRIEPDWRWTFFLGTCLTLSAMPRTADAQEKVDLDTIAKAWQKRQDRVKSGRFAWTERRTMARGYQNGPDSKTPNKDPVVPPTEVTYETTVSFLFDGDGIRYSYTDQWWGPDTGKLIQSPYLCVYGGGLEKRLRDKGVLHSWPQGLIKKVARHGDVANPQLRPILMTYRAKNPFMRTYDIEQFVLTGKRVIIDKRPCVELVRKRAASRAETIDQLLLDPAQNYVVVRNLTIEKGVVIVQLDVQYQEHAVAGIVPQHWTITNTHPSGNGKFYFSTKATGIEVEINGKSDPSEFDIKFPEGTYVADETTGKYYILKPGGGKRNVGKNDAGKSYDELLATSDLPSTGSFLLMPWGIMATVVTVSAASLLLWREVKRRRHRHS